MSAVTFMSYFSTSQVVLTIESPASIAGNYDVTYGEPAAGWSSPDMSSALNALNGTMAIVDDGTVADSLGCNPLVNGVDIMGKIAVIYRGSCQFGTKALQAQNAGAVAVLLINNIAGDPIGMNGGDDGGSVIIPVFMISQINGQVITDVISSGTPVTAFLGNKSGLFDNDLKVVKDRVILPSPNTNHALLAQTGSEFTSRIGAWLYNDGNADQTGAVFKAEVFKDGNILYTQSSTGLDIVSGDSIYIELPVFSNPTYTVGKYTLTYSVTPSVTDEYANDNSYDVDFFISNDIFSYVNIDADGLPISTTGYRSTTATTTFSSCIVLDNANASRVKADGLYFSASAAATFSLNGQQLISTAYKINDVFANLNDLDFNTVGIGLENLEEVGNGDYTYDNDTMDYTMVYAPFSAPVLLNDNQRYMFCVSTFDANTYLGYGNLDYQWTVDTVLQPLFPIQSNTTWNIVGFGGESASIGVKMSDVNSTGITENIKSNVTVYPNPTNNVINVKGIDASNYNTIELKDQLGRTIKTWNISTTSIELNVSKFEVGNYFLQFNGKNGNMIEKIQILK